MHTAPPEGPTPPPDAPAATPLPRDFALEPANPPTGPAFMFGFVTGLLAFQALLAGGHGRWVSTAVGLALGAVVAAVLAWNARRRAPDRVHVDVDALTLRRGDLEVARVRLDRLDEVNELDTPDGSILVLGDRRTTLGLPASMLANAREYVDLTSSVVEAMRRTDPTGTLGARAVEAGRARQRLAAVPVRATIWLALLLVATGFATIVGLDGHWNEPFVYERAGALGAPLVLQGETYRLLSYTFLASDGVHLVLTCLTVLWIGTWLERVAGWERTLLAFTLGVAAHGAVLVALAFPTTVVGAGGGAAGMLGAVAGLLLTGRVGAFFRPRRDFWGVVLGATALLLVFQPAADLALRVAPSEYPWQVAAGHLAAFAVGALAALALAPGHAFPLAEGDRNGARAFGWLAVAALAIGLVGGALHQRRDDHPDDAAVLASALLDAKLGPTVRAHAQNEAAYTLLFMPGLGQKWLGLCTQLAEQAVDDTDGKVPEILDTLAVARYLAGQREDAASLVKQALDVVRAVPEAHPRRAALIDQLQRRLSDVEAGAVLER